MTSASLKCVTFIPSTDNQAVESVVAKNANLPSGSLDERISSVSVGVAAAEPSPEVKALSEAKITLLESQIQISKAKEGQCDMAKIGGLVTGIVSLFVPPVGFVVAGGSLLWFIKTCIDDSNLKSNRDGLELQLEGAKLFNQQYPDKIGDDKARTEFIDAHKKAVKEERARLAKEDRVRGDHLADDYGGGDYFDGGVSYVSYVDCSSGVCVDMCCDADGNCAPCEL